MTTSNARKINVEKDITVTRRVARRNTLAMQKLVGVLMLAVVAMAVVIGGDVAAAIVLAPLALAAVFSKGKVLDFGIFSKNVRYYK